MRRRGQRHELTRASRCRLYTQPDINAEIQRLRAATGSDTADPDSRPAAQQRDVATPASGDRNNRELSEDNQRLRRQLAQALGHNRWGAAGRQRRSGIADKPAKTTTIGYRDVLTQLWLLDPLPAWLPVDNAFRRLAGVPKHHLADPALAARLLQFDAHSLRDPGAWHPPGTGRSVLAALFESLVVLSVRTYAQASEAQVSHLRTRDGDHEVDLIVEGHGARVVAFEVKLAPAVNDDDVRHIRWLHSKIRDRLADAAVITTGPSAYRRRDGIAVIPLALLGP